MRKLHLVGLTTDRDGLIFTARKGSKSGGFIVPLDAKVLAAVAEAGARHNGRPVEAAVAAGDAVPKRLRSESALTPREMQARLRAGRSIEEVAAEAGVDTEWVARFAVPILAEQAQVVELARNLVYAKPRLGESSQQLGPSVLQNLSDRGVFLPDDVANAGWSAFQLHDSVWMVRFRYRARGRDQEAQWEIDVPTGRLRARNRHASDLGYVDFDRWQASVEPDESLIEEEPAVPVAPRRRSARAAPEPDAEVKRLPAAKRRAVSRPPPARPAPPAKAAAKPVRAKKPAKTAAPTTSAAPRKAKSTKASAAARPAPKAAPAGAKASPRTAAAKSPAKRRSPKAVTGPDAGPAAGSGSVRLAVAQVSTARVAASMAAADREPWAAAVRRSGRSAAPSAEAGGVRRGEGRRAPSRSGAAEPVRQLRQDDTAPVRAFQPRPLPPPGQEPVAARVRKVTVPRKAVDPDVAPSVSLPAPRRPAPQQEAMPVERAKRRRLRSR